MLIVAKKVLRDCLKSVKEILLGLTVNEIVGMLMAV